MIHETPTISFPVFRSVPSIFPSDKYTGYVRPILASEIPDIALFRELLSETTTLMLISFTLNEISLRTITFNIPVSPSPLTSNAIPALIQDVPSVIPSNVRNIEAYIDVSFRTAVVASLITDIQILFLTPLRNAGPRLSPSRSDRARSKTVRKSIS